MTEYYPAHALQKLYDPYTPLQQLMEARKTQSDTAAQNLNVEMGKQRLNVLKSVLGDGTGTGGTGEPSGGLSLGQTNGGVLGGSTVGLGQNQLQALAIASPESANALVNTQKGLTQAKADHLALRTNALFQAVAGATDQQSWDQNLDWAAQNGYIDPQDYQVRKQQGFSPLGRSQLLTQLGGIDSYFKQQGIFAEKGVRQNPDGSVTPLPGYAAAQAGIEGAKAGAEAGAKFPYESAMQLNKPAEIAPGGMRVVPPQVSPGRSPLAMASPVAPVAVSPLGAISAPTVASQPSITPQPPMMPPVAPVSPAISTQASPAAPTGRIATSPVATNTAGGSVLMNPNSPALMGQLPAYNEKTGAAVADYINQKQAAVPGITKTLYAAQDLRKALKDLPTGPGTTSLATASKFMERFGVDINKALPGGWQTDPTKSSIAQKNISQLASAWAQGNFPTRITDADMQIALSAMPSQDLNNAKANEHLLDNLEAAQRIGLEEAKFYRQEMAKQSSGQSPGWDILDKWQDHLFNMKDVPDPVKRSFMAYSDMTQNPQVPTPAVNALPAGAVNYATGPNGEKGFIFKKPSGDGYFMGNQNGEPLK